MEDTVFWEDIGEMIRVLVKRFGILNANCCDTCCGEEVSPAQSHIILEIGKRSCPSMQDVAKCLCMDITTFSRQIKTLEARGLVIKSPDPGDKRINLLALTPEGTQVRNKINNHMREYLNLLFSGMTEFERDTVVRSVKLLSEALENSGICCFR